MSRPFRLVLAIALTAGCRAASPENSDSELQHFFSSSKRRAAVGDESAMVARVGGCAAFFLENNSGSVFLSSARHCFRKSITTWCSNGGAIRTNDGKTGRCKRVVAADAQRDIAVFEASFPDGLPAMKPLRLAARSPESGTALKMIGYPADPWRRSALTVTENCKANGKVFRSPHRDLLDKSMQHNCSTYGGNSGGPMLRDGTNEVIGLPFTYYPLNSFGGYTTANPFALENQSAYLALMSDFVSAHKDALRAAGIAISGEPGSEATGSIYTAPHLANGEAFLESYPN